MLKRSRPNHAVARCVFHTNSATCSGPKPSSVPSSAHTFLTAVARSSAPMSSAWSVAFFIVSRKSAWASRCCAALATAQPSSLTRITRPRMYCGCIQGFAAAMPMSSKPSARSASATGLPSVPCTHAAPRSTLRPRSSWVRTRPPTLSVASSTRTESTSASRAFAHASPARPAPMTITSASSSMLSPFASSSAASSASRAASSVRISASKSMGPRSLSASSSLSSSSS
mmetsp:Transcript_29982/g.95813  ORF Transcript_29982/g.95813 Transcript_29982/m.95813 type:complete len:228 (+) Transcript_29982:2437-3120(+)